MESSVLNILLWGLTGLLILATLMPLSKLPHGSVRGLAFPREQFFGLALVLAIAMFFTQSGHARWIGTLLLLLVAGAQAIYIAKFTPFWRRQSVKADGDLVQARDRRVSLLASNVKLSNRAYGRLISLIRERDPDIGMAIEVDADWIAALSQEFRADYPYWVEVPKTNGYGLCVMSKLELRDTQVREMITDGVPSIRATVVLRDGAKFRLYVVHPEPPVIDHDTQGRDAEIALIGMEAAEDPLPAIVTGDLNDVAWSTTTRRFQRLSGLLDPRVGRGFYNTFSATMPWMRWPLDHLFHDPKFRLVYMERTEKIGSDHFPMWFVLALAASEKADADPGESDVEEEREVVEMVEDEKKREREAIGSDWED
ncbi:endonuclease/exonuclease/phosphatase family protein [Sulfitobacter aestuarii]|uniref:Endonuclease/exonuclease/phosphatase family protein n=1 Tax=Sulfitobacter aestuarii TaxID=2161676 RepID=A0ABW5TYI2_9RHOB